MTLRRVFVGAAVVFGLSVWSWSSRTGEEPAPAHPANQVLAAEAAPGGNYDDAAHRYRTGQSRHWRQVMIGTH